MRQCRNGLRKGRRLEHDEDRGRQVGSGTASLVLVLDFARPGGHSAVPAVARQDAGFLVVSEARGGWRRGVAIT